MSSQVAWLNFDAEQQRRTQLLMNALAGKSTIDELGMGPFRDLISRSVNPHLTVLHTRARYLIFLPGIYSSLSGASAEAVYRHGRNQEAELAKRLARHYGENADSDGTGIIGRIAGAEARQPSSTAFWGLIEKLDILKTDISVRSYARAVANQRVAGAAIRGLHDEDEHVVDPRSMWIDLAGLEGASTDKEAVSFDLTAGEAQFLQERFLEIDADLPADQRSLTSWLIDPQRKTWCENVRYAWDHPESGHFPAATAAIVDHGRQVDNLVHGARVVYNYWCDRGSPEGERRDELLDEAEGRFRQWRDDVEAQGLPSEAKLAQINDWVGVAMAERGASDTARFRWERTFAFLVAWSRMSADEGGALLTSSAAAELVTKREASLKGSELARLTNQSRLKSWSAHAGMFHLDFNWGVVQRILGDVHQGLGTEIIDARAN